MFLRSKFYRKPQTDFHFSVIIHQVRYRQSVSEIRLHVSHLMSLCIYVHRVNFTSAKEFEHLIFQFSIFLSRISYYEKLTVFMAFAGFRELRESLDSGYVTSFSSKMRTPSQFIVECICSMDCTVSFLLNN